MDNKINVNQVIDPEMDSNVDLNDVKVIQKLGLVVSYGLNCCG